MGGGGSYYDRDVTSKSFSRSDGTSELSQKALSRSKVDKALLPKDRQLVCDCKSPIVYAFDVTGSMQQLPKIIWDKMPMIAGQIVEKKYLADPMISLAAIGDVIGDVAPIQIADFSLIRNLDSWLQRIWLEKGGGDGYRESYEFTAYYYARYLQIPKAVTPFFLFTGDEAFREEMVVPDLTEHFGGQHKKVSAFAIFEELKQKFRGNVFLLHRLYGNSAEKEIVSQWKKALGEEKIVFLPEDKAVADVTLGIFAIASGSKTLPEYLEEMKEREQTKSRIDEVSKALEVLASLAKSKPADADEEEDSAADEEEKKPGNKPANKKKKPGSGKKPGRF